MLAVRWDTTPYSRPTWRRLPTQTYSYCAHHRTASSKPHHGLDFTHQKFPVIRPEYLTSRLTRCILVVHIPDIGNIVLALCTSVGVQGLVLLIRILLELVHGRKLVNWDGLDDRSVVTAKTNVLICVVEQRTR